MTVTKATNYSQQNEAYCEVFHAETKVADFWVLV